MIPGAAAMLRIYPKPAVGSGACRCVSVFGVRVCRCGRGRAIIQCAVWDTGIYAREPPPPLADKLYDMHAQFTLGWQDAIRTRSHQLRSEMFC